MIIAILNIDCHVHTCYSGDSELSLARLVEACKAKGISGVCITDHNTIAGAVKLAELAPFPVVVGEEIMTTAGKSSAISLHRKSRPDCPPRQRSPQ